MPNPRIDPASQRYGLHGRVVTMNAAFTVIDSGTIFIDAGRIVAALPDDAPAPPGFEDAPIVRSGGTIYPCLIELHNHLSYNALPLWALTERCSNRARPPTMAASSQKRRSPCSSVNSSKSRRHQSRV